MDNNEIGKKIKKYRRRANMSQMELELATDAAFGSISRIENGKVNPTKETLSKIAEILKIKPSEIGDLLGLQIYSTEELIRAINTISKSLSLDTTLQTAVDIMFDLFPNYNGGSIYLLKDGCIHSKTVSNIKGMTEALKLLPDKFSNLKLSVQDNPDNYFVRSIKGNICLQSKSLFDFGKGIANIINSNIAQKLIGYSCGVSIPMNYNNIQIGVILYIKRNEDSFTDNEISLLKLLTDQIAITIRNTQIIDEINHDLDSLKGKIQKFLA
jgi:transcriptional regulator with XRE-family HTH domain